LADGRRAVATPGEVVVTGGAWDNQTPTQAV
jgi:hypothetical protein